MLSFLRHFAGNRYKNNETEKRDDRKTRSDASHDDLMNIVDRPSEAEKIAQLFPR